MDLLRLILLIVLSAATSLGISPAAATDDQDAASPGTATTASPDPSPLPAADTADRIIGSLTFAAHTMAPRIRPGAPWWLHIRLAANDHLRSGRLHVTVSEEDHPAAEWTSDPWTITPSMRDSVVVMPAIAPGGDGQLTATFTWLGDDGDIGLGTQDLTLPGIADRDLVIALVNPPAAADPPWREIALDRCMPPEERRPHLALHTSLARMTADDVPDQPLAFCAVDLLAIDAAEAAHLRAAQISALATWVRAGGALCVFGATAADDDHDLIPGLRVPGLEPLGSVAHTASFYIYAKTALADDGLAAVIRGASLGLGRVLVAPQSADHDSPAWRAATAYLWRVREMNAETMIAVGTWTAGSLQETMSVKESARYDDIQMPFGPVVSADSAQRIQALLEPRGFSGLPWWLLVAICAVFIVLIGPADWLILGRLKRRRWTWVVFPVVALAITSATVATSQVWLGSHDRLRRLEVVTLDRDGKPLRRDRFELHLAGHDQDVAIPCHDETFIDTTNSVDETRSYYSSRKEIVAHPVIPHSGAFPDDFSALIHLPQWSPVLLHRMDLGTSIEAASLPTWTWPTDPGDPAAWAAAIPGPAAVQVWDASRRCLREGPPGILSDAELRAEQPGNEVMNHLPLESIPSHIFVDLQGWDFRALVAGTAPSGGLDLADLPLEHAPEGADGDGPLVVVVTPTDDGWRILCRPCPQLRIPTISREEP